MKKVKILNEQSKPTTPTQASEQGWKLSKEKAKTVGGCDDSGLEQIVINNRSYYKCKEGSQPNTETRRKIEASSVAIYFIGKQDETNNSDYPIS